MTNDRIRQLLEAYGADPARWPTDDREAAALLAADADAQRLAADAGRLDALIGAHAAPARPLLDVQTLVARVTATPQPRGFAVNQLGADGGAVGWRLSFGWPKLAGLASIAIVGFVVGLTDLDASLAQAEDEEAPAGIFGVFEDSPW